MASASVELHQVTEELEDLEQQLEVLLERQQRLLEKQRHLQSVLVREESGGGSDLASGVNGASFDKTDFTWSTDLQTQSTSVFSIHCFRPLQLRTMNTTLSGKDCILVMPTGGGKSLCFQLPAVVSQGVTLVVSPLISLMEDQLFALHKLGVAAELLNASSTKEKVNSVHAAMTDKKADLKLLYVTPEKLAKSKRFMNKLEKMYEAGRFARLVIDEVHCCSQWGHDFRPDYKFLGIMKKQFPRVPILGLTATATSTVMEDVKKILAIRDCLVYKASFNRHNLYYEVKIKPSGLQASVDDMYSLIKTRFKGQSGIVYCFSQKDTEDVARELTSRGLAASCYHGNLDPKYRSQVHSRWITNQIQVVVATIAFGMGIDKPDVRFVIHHSISKSMENYYQESGRAGRDEQKAHCILYTSFQDGFRQSTMVFTEQTGLEKLYNMVEYAYNLTECRRTLIARHFGEIWDSSQCHGMCDHCDTEHKVETTTRNMTEHCQAVVSTLYKHKGKTRLTGLKLMDAWLGKGANSRLSRQDAERLLVYMLLEGYLKEDFHFTAYTTISYLVIGPREYRLQRPNQVVEVPYKVKSKSATTKASNMSATTKPNNKSTGHQNKMDKPATKTELTLTSSANSNTANNLKRPKIPCVVSANSKVTSGLLVSDSLSSPGNRGSKCDRGEKTSQKVRKKKRVITSDDSDSELDFGEIISLKKSRKGKPGEGEGEERGSGGARPAGVCNGQEVGEECITLDSD